MFLFTKHYGWYKKLKKIKAIVSSKKLRFEDEIISVHASTRA